MPVSGLEAVADAIQRYEGWDPKTRSYMNRNPGNLRAGVHINAHAADAYPVDEKGFYVYPDLATGYSSLVRDLRAKFTGQNDHGLGPASTLLGMMKIYAPSADANNPLDYAQFIAKWASMVLNKPLTEQSELCNIWVAANPPAPVTTA
jgi:hypothetical protein